MKKVLISIVLVVAGIALGLLIPKLSNINIIYLSPTTQEETSSTTPETTIETTTSESTTEAIKTTQAKTPTPAPTPKNENCIGKYCVPESIALKKKGTLLEGTSIDHPQTDEEIQHTYQISVDKKYFSHTYSEIMHSNTLEAIQITPKTLVVTETDGGCGSNTVTQKITGSVLPENILAPVTITIGDITLRRSVDFKISSSIADNTVKNLTATSEEKGVSLTNSGVAQSIISDAVNSSKSFSQKYLLKDPISHLAYVYTADNTPSSVYIVQLGTDAAWLSENLDSQGNLLNKSLSQKILGYFGTAKISNYIMAYANNQMRLENITAENMPLFKVKKFDDKGNYLLYPTQKYVFSIMAELCKPVVYYYSDIPEYNSLTIETQNTLDTFTKVIPDFSQANTWYFTSKGLSDSSVYFNHIAYPYLYYSIQSSNFRHKTDGWIVQGKDIGTFFSEKLNKIGFNAQEKKDFIAYWAPEYNPESYYFVSFLFNEEVDHLVKLGFMRAPDRIFRVLLDSYELDGLTEHDKHFLYAGKPDARDNVLLQTFERGLGSREVFEWGGVITRGDGSRLVY